MLARLRAARRRLFLHALLRHLAGALAVAAWGIALLTASSRLWPATFGSWWLVPWAGAAALVLAVLFAVRLAGRRTPDLVGVARRAERRFGLDERLSTSLELQEGEGALVSALHADAESAAQRLDPRQLTSLRPTPLLTTALVAGLLASVGAGLLPERTEASAPTAAAGGAEQGVTADGGAFIQELLDLHAPSVTTAPAGAQSATATQREATVAGTAAQPSGGAPNQQASVGSGLATAPAALVERASDASGDAVQASAAGRTADAAPPAEEAPRAQVRNDGSTNPSFAAASSRDQELREYARRRQVGSDPGGGGGGDQVAMADAAVAGSATAGLGGEEAALLPVVEGGDAPALELPAVTDVSGRRVTLERLPDDVTAAVSANAPSGLNWPAMEEPPVRREALGSDDLDLLRRYHRPEDAP